MRANLSRCIYAVLLALCPVLVSAASMTAKVAFLEGKAVVIDAAGGEKGLKMGTTLREGDTVRLDNKSSRVVLMLSDGSELRLKGKTQMRFAEFNKSASGATRKTRLELAWGGFWTKVAKLTTKSSRFEVKAGGVVCGVRGTVIGGEFDNQSGEGSFQNFEGDVFLDAGNGPINLGVGQSCPFNPKGLGVPRNMGARQHRQFRFGPNAGNEGNGGSGGNGAGIGAGNGEVNPMLALLLQDLRNSVRNTQNDNTNATGAAQGNAVLLLQMNGPEGTGNYYGGPTSLY